MGHLRAPRRYFSLRVWYLVVVLTVAVGFLSQVGAVAQTNSPGVVWVGRMTIGDIVRRDASEVATAVGNFGQARSKLNVEIASARRAFFSTASDPSSRSAAERRFAELLLIKDWTYMVSAVPIGFDRDTDIRLSALNVDGGIPTSALPAFREWVNGIRRSLGATRPTQTLVFTESEAKSAIDVNWALYNSYKLKRDEAEFLNRQAEAVTSERSQEWLKQHKDAVASDGSSKLHRQTVLAFSSLHASPPGTSVPAREKFQAWMKSAEGTGQQVLACVYGPVRVENTGPVYDTELFWHKAPPPELVRTREEGGQFVSNLGLTLASAECFPTAVFARDAIRQAQFTYNADAKAVRRDIQAQKKEDEKSKRSAASDAHREVAERRRLAALQSNCQKRKSYIDQLHQQTLNANNPAALKNYEAVRSRYVMDCKGVSS